MLKPVVLILFTLEPVVLMLLCLSHLHCACPIMLVPFVLVLFVLVPFVLVPFVLVLFVLVLFVLVPVVLVPLAADVITDVIINSTNRCGRTSCLIIRATDNVRV
jgi:hypothetical protein